MHATVNTVEFNCGRRAENGVAIMLDRWTLSFCREIILLVVRREEKFSPKVGDGFDPEGPMSHSL